LSLELDVDKELALLSLQKAADGGQGEAQYFLGCAYEYGGALGLDVNLETALEMYQRAAEGGDEHAQYKLSKAYNGGNLGGGTLGLDADQEKAFEWLYKAAEGGCSDAVETVEWLESIGRYCDFCMRPEQVCEDSAVLCGKPLWAMRWGLSEYAGATPGSTQISYVRAVAQSLAHC
jgi:hypothetical protein